MCSIVYFILQSAVLIIFVKVTLTAKINLIDCGVDHDEEVTVGEVETEMYPWLGVLYYSDADMSDVRAVTPVVLIHESFVLASAKDIVEMPVTGFKRYARVLLGEGWKGGPGRRVRSYVIHQEYGETYNTLALVYLRDAVRNGVIKPMCPPSEVLTDPEFYVVRFQNDYNHLQKEVIPMFYVPPRLCRDFYVAANLYAVKMRPPHVVCACSMEHDNVCVWDVGSMLVSRDVWGRWMLLGFGVRGPGCSGPSRYLDMASYYPWIHEALYKFQPITISKISNHKFVLRASGVTESITTASGSYTLQRYGICDESEQEQYQHDMKIEMLYRDKIKLVTDNNQYQFLTYNLTVIQAVEITCMTMELVNASSSSELKVKHSCPRKPNLKQDYKQLQEDPVGNSCHMYRGSAFDISIYIMFADKCTFEINIWGIVKPMVLIDKLQWRYEEGTYYEDFNVRRVEYRGPTFMTGFGFQDLDTAMWIPLYDMYTSTEFDPYATKPTTTEPPPIDGVYVEQIKSAFQKPIPTRRSSLPTKSGFKRSTPTSTRKFIFVPGFLGP